MAPMETEEHFRSLCCEVKQTLPKTVKVIISEHVPTTITVINYSEKKLVGFFMMCRGVLGESHLFVCLGAFRIPSLELT